jgi:hypothetical protein
MNKLSFLPAILTVGSFLLSACGVNFELGSGKIVSETRVVSNIESISFSGMGNLFLEQGDQETLKIEADDNLIPYIKSEVHNGVLTIFFNCSNSHIIYPSQPVRIYVTAKNISELELSGSGQVISDKIITNSMDMDISGSGRVNIKQLKADVLTARISGSSRCELEGEVASQKIVISGSGVCDTTQLVSHNANVSVSGSGRALVSADESLDAHVTGSGKVGYFGNPKVMQSVQGSGSVYQQQEKSK